MAADINLEKMQNAKLLLEQALENLRQGRINSDDVQNAKRRILLERVQSYESNTAVATYYVTSRYQLQATSKLDSREAAIESVTPEDIKRVANKYLRTDRQVAMWSTPTFTYTQFVVVLAVLLIGVPGMGFVLVRRFIRRRRAS